MFCKSPAFSPFVPGVLYVGRQTLCIVYYSLYIIFLNIAEVGLRLSVNLTHMTAVFFKIALSGET